ncbi:hypothetical protein EC957_009165 [Mortierella hygrophila]|uniref:Uncharacterized protein n=1 Tax=Mortierella hygrophila TaxID=979708 RepID=A0A9P6FJ27_9FUNG|nr:hypothetical protein EC957_009165 [Mortierella hygrophila]
MSLVYYTYLTTAEGAYRTEPEPRPTPAVPPPPPSPSPPPQRPSPKPAPNPTTTDSATTEALPLAAKSTSKDSSTATTEAGSQQTHGVSENEPTTTTTTTSTTTTTKDDGGGGATAGGGSSPTLPLPPERTTSDGGSSPEPTGVQPTSSRPGAQPTNGGITLQPGSTMVFHNPSDASSTPAPAISGPVISAPMTGVVFTFAFLGALIIGLVAGFFIAKHTRLGGGGGGGGRSHRQQRDELTEQVRLLIDTIGQRNSRNFDNGPQQPYRHDRSYLDDEKFAHASVTHQGERMPLYMNSRQSVASTFTAAHGGDDGETERLHPHPIPDQNQYQEWDLVNSHLISPHSNNVPSHSMSFSRHSAMVSPLAGPPTTNRASRPESSGTGTFLSPRVVHLPPTQLPPDVDIYSPKGEWGSLSDIRGGGGGGGGGNASRTSVADLNEFERRRPQIQEEGEGEDSLFSIEHPRHNPHVTAIME